jgi:ribosomal protein S19
MDSHYCEGCFKEQRSLNDIYQQTKIDAQSYANKENKTVAILPEGAGFSFQVYQGAPPSGTREIIIPNA